MEVEVKRIDHLGIIAGVIKDLGIIEIVDNILGVDEQEHISYGEALAGMIINALGFSNSVLTLTPKFFKNKDLERLIREGVKAEHFNRHKLGRLLDAIFKYGCEKFFSLLALRICEIEKIDMSFGHGDTTSFSFSGEYNTEGDTGSVAINYGYSKAKRPDLKQVILELFVSQDGGIPFIQKLFDGNESDSAILRERVEKLIKEFAKSGSRCLVADSKLYAEPNAKNLNAINYITRVPASINKENEYITLALQRDGAWVIIPGGYKYQVFKTDHYGIEDQRWIVVYSDQARQRSLATLEKQVTKQQGKAKKGLSLLQKERFMCESDALKALNAYTRKWRFHSISNAEVAASKHYTKAGRPGKESLEKTEFQIVNVTIDRNQASFDQELDQRSCFVLATNMPEESLSAQEVLKTYKKQDEVEKSFAFLKSPDFFASAIFLKSPSRIEALVTVMVLSLVVYSVAQRRLRQQLETSDLTVPNQINKPIKDPTMRWVFQLFDGIECVKLCLNGIMHTMIAGLNDLTRGILGLLGSNVQKIYQAYDSR